MKLECKGKIMMKEILLYHGGKEVIEFPEIRKTKYTKDYYAEFKYPTHQMSFHTLKALDCLQYERSERVE